MRNTYQVIKFKENKWALSPHRRNVSQCLRDYMLISLVMTLTFDLWPSKPFQQWPITWWRFVSSFFEVRPLNTEISRHANVNGWTNEQPENNASAAVFGGGMRILHAPFVLPLSIRYVWKISNDTHNNVIFAWLESVKSIVICVKTRRCRHQSSL